MKVEAYFESIKTANEVVNKLRSEGFNKSYVDINEHRNDVYSNSGFVGSHEVPTISAAVLGENDTSPLSAASPMASGMGGFQEIADINCKVVAEVSEKDKENVKSLLIKMGATIDDPNTGKIPKGLDNINEDVLILKNLDE